MKYVQFSICVTPDPDSDLARFGKHWFGWDMDQANDLPFIRIKGFPASILSLTASLRRFGFQAPLLKPFRLAEGHSPLSLHHTAQALAAHIEPMKFPGMYLSGELGHLSLRLLGEGAALARLRHIVDEVFVEYLAPPTRPDDAPARRRSELSAHQMQAVIDRAPLPCDAKPTFGFTMSETRPQEEINSLRRRLIPSMAPALPRPFLIRSLSLCGEDPSGWTRVIQRYPLTGGADLKPMHDRIQVASMRHVQL